MQCSSKRGPLPERVDITILGGGVNGVALARQCDQAHKSVLLLERDDFASGTTSRSSRIVHGGLRYLEHGALGMLRESLQGRAALLRHQPHLVQPLDFVLAAAPRSRYSALEFRAALWLYRKLGKFPPAADGPETESLRRSLDPARRWAIYPYQDAQCEFPERLVADWLRDACAARAIARNHLTVLAIRASEGRVRGVRLRDSVTGEESYIESEWVINAAGPWVDLVRDLTGLAAPSPLASGIRESHIMLRPWPGAPTIGLHASTRKGRPISIAPWNGMLQVGVTETRYSGDPSLAEPNAEEAEFLLGSATALFPQARLTAADIVFSYAGVRPVPYRPGRSPFRSGVAPCRHCVHNHAEEGALGLLSIFGATLTTADSLARKTAHTMGLHPPGGEPVPQFACDESSDVQTTLQQWATAVHASTGISRESTEAIARWHGRHAMCIVHNAMRDPVLRAPILDGRPQLVAQAVEAVAYEHALTLADILLRRVPMALDRDWNEDSTLQAASRIAPALHWSERRIREQIEAFEEERGHFLHKPGTLKPDGVAA